MSVGGNDKGNNEAVNGNVGFNRDETDRGGASRTVEGVQVRLCFWTNIKMEVCR